MLVKAVLRNRILKRPSINLKATIFLIVWLPQMTLLNRTNSLNCRIIEIVDFHLTNSNKVIQYHNGTQLQLC